jgi:hypothetical protein
MNPFLNLNKDQMKIQIVQRKNHVPMPIQIIPIKQEMIILFILILTLKKTLRIHISHPVSTKENITLFPKLFQIK